MKNMFLLNLFNSTLLILPISTFSQLNNDNFIIQPKIEIIYNSCGDIIFEFNKSLPLLIHKTCIDLGITPTISQIYEILVELCDQGVVIFEPNLPEMDKVYIDTLKDIAGDKWHCYLYVLSKRQNDLLLLNLNANASLFKDGELISNAGKFWKVFR